MASNFPTSLDAFTNPSSTDAMDSVSVPHATQHSDLNDAVEALQAKVGADSSAVTTSHDYKIAALEAQGTWTSWTPTWTNLSVGNGTVTAEYAQVGQIVFYRVQLLFGSTTSITGSVRIHYPFQADDTYLGSVGGSVHMEDSSPVNLYVGVLNRASTTTAFPTVINSSGTYAGYTGMNATTPFTWATGDRLLIEDFYKAA